MELSLTELLTGPLVIGVRISGLMLFAPFFGNGAIPPRIKAILVILITACCTRRTPRRLASLR